jgi:uncharacterized repeat protein (TIGR01451 family)/fimbrial isopeptide formation D2 family protein
MPNSLAERIARQRIWVTWALVFFVVFAQSAWEYSPAAAASPAQLPAIDRRDASLPQVRALPLWFEPPSTPQAQQSVPSLTKSTSVVTATIDQVIDYTIVYTIPAGFGSVNFVLEDTVPSYPDLVFNITPGSYNGPIAVTPDTPPVSPVAPTFSDSNHKATWALGALGNPSGNPYVYQITYQAIVQSGNWNWGQSATNNAHLRYNGSDVSAASSITIHRPDLYPRLSVEASNGQRGAYPQGSAPQRDIDDLIQGQVVTFTLQVTNANAARPAYWPYLSPAYDMRLHFELPNFLQYAGTVGSTPDPVQSAQPNGETHLDWQDDAELASLGPHEALNFMFRATVKPDVTANRDERPLYRVDYHYLPDGPTEASMMRNSLHLRSRTLSLVKRASTDALLVGDEVTYTIHFTLPDGVSVMTPIYLEDTLDDGFDWRRSLSATPDFDAPPDVSRDGNNTIIRWDWTGDDIAQPGTYVFTFTAILSSSLKSGAPIPWTALKNEAELFWHDAYDIQRNANSEVHVQVIRPSIPLNKEVWTGSSWGEILDLSAGGQSVRFRIKGDQNPTGLIRNEPTNTSTAYEIVISDTLPPGFEFDGANPTPSQTSQVGDQWVVSWGVYPSLDPGEELPIHYITATAPIALTPDSIGYIYNYATAVYSDREGTPAEDNVYADTDYAAVRTAGMVGLTKTADPSGDAVRIGDVVTFTLVARLAPGSVLHAPFISDQGYSNGMKAGYHYIDGSFTIDGATATPITITRYNREELHWDFADRLSNTTEADQHITSTVRVRFTGVDLYGDPIHASTWDDFRTRQDGQNTARLYWFLESAALNRRDRSDFVDDGIGIIQPLLVDPNLPPQKALVDGGPVVESGDLLTYRFTIYNTGLAPAYDALISDTLPPGLGFQSYQARVYPVGTGGPPYEPSVSVAPATGDEGSLEWVFDEIAEGDGNTASPSTQLVLTYTVQVIDSVGSGATLVNSAWVSDYSSQPGDHAYERHYAYLGGAGDQASPVSVARAQIGKTASVSDVALGDSMVYTITVPKEPLGATMYNVVVTDTMPIPPPGPLHVLGAMAPGATSPPTVTSDTVSASFDSIPAGSQEMIIISAQVPVTATGGLVYNDATVSWEDATSNGTRHSETSDPIAVSITTPDVRVNKAAPRAASPGFPIRYTISYANDGTATAEQVRLTDTLPTGVTFTGFSYDRPVSQIGPLVWDLGSLAPGESGTVWLTATVWSTATMGSSLENTVTIGTPSPGDDPTNNDDTAITIVSAAVLNVTKTAAPDPVLAGERLQYTLVVTNSGAESTQNLVITDRIPANTSFVSASPGGSLASDFVKWSPRDIGTGGRAEVSFEVLVPSHLLSGTLVVNDAYGAVADNAPNATTDPVTVTVSTAGEEPWVIYLPILTRNYVEAVPPLGVNLVIQSIQTSPASPIEGQATRISVTLHNSGTGAVTEDFWVDLYVDPASTPTINVLWNHISPYGKAWFVHDDIPAGGTLVIRSDQPDDATDPDAIYSNWPGWFVGAGEHILYAQVDSYGQDWGLVPEENESDNVTGPTTVTVGPGIAQMAQPPPIQWQERR